MKSNITLNEATTNKLRNLLGLIDAEESKDSYEDIDCDAVLEYTDEIIKTLRGILFS